MALLAILQNSGDDERAVRVEKPRIVVEIRPEQKKPSGRKNYKIGWTKSGKSAPAFLL